MAFPNIAPIPFGAPQNPSGLNTLTGGGNWSVGGTAPFGEHSAAAPFAPPSSTGGNPTAPTNPVAPKPQTKQDRRTARWQAYWNQPSTKTFNGQTFTGTRQEVENKFNLAQWGTEVRTFPKVTGQGDNWKRYADNSYVDYSSSAWKKAAGYQPVPELAPIWNQLPDSWKADIINWDPSFVTAYLSALSTGDRQVMYQGKFMRGTEAATQIQTEARNYQKSKATYEQQLAQKQKQFQQKQRTLGTALNPTITPSPFL
jgi:hypothetical protein